MKGKLMTLALALTTTGAFAQTNISANQVCQRMATVNASNASICAQLISRNSFDPAALSLAHKAIPQGSAFAISILQTSANRRLDSNAGNTCERILEVNANNSVECLKAVLDTAPSLDLLKVANKMIPHGSTHAVNVLKSNANAYFFGPLVDVCEAMVSVNAGNAVVCMQEIANKVSQQGSEQICRTSLSQGSAYTLQCLRGIVTEYVPYPQTIAVDFYQIQELRKSLLKARALLDRGLLDNSKKSLDEALGTLEVIMNSNY